MLIQLSFQVFCVKYVENDHILDNNRDNDITTVEPA